MLSNVIVFWNFAVSVVITERFPLSSELNCAKALYTKAEQNQ